MLLVWAVAMLFSPFGHGVAASAATYDYLRNVESCRVTSDGAVWYIVRRGSFSPVDVRSTDCRSRSLGVVRAPVPSWAKPQGRTRALFSAVSLIEIPRVGPVEPLADLAHSLGVPLTFLMGWEWIPADVTSLEHMHRYGDDVQVAPPNVERARESWSWFRPVVSVLGAGWERHIEETRAAALDAFWGITWNSSGVDLTSDRGAPWGFYCADPASYKRPAQDQRCDLGAVEWTARDLTMAYETGREDAYSTDPDDLRLRAHLSVAAASQYEREMVDAYAAAGEQEPLLMVAQEEASEFAESEHEDAPILHALYDEAKRDGMQILNLADATRQLQKLSPQNRVVAFPALASSGRFGPATIDAFDSRIGMTFHAAELMPDRVFAYSRADVSRYNVPVPQLSAAETPRLLETTIGEGHITLRFESLISMRYGVAFWSDPAIMRWTSPNVVPAGRAGAVAFFNLEPGINVITLGCIGCTRAALPYAGV